MLPTADIIREQEPKARPLPVEPWVAANLSRLWQAMKKNIQTSIAAGSLTVGQANPMGRHVSDGTYSSATSSCAGKLAPPHTAQSTPASSHNHS